MAVAPRSGDPGGQADAALDPALLPRLPGQRGAAALFALAYNLATFLRSLALPSAVAQRSLTALREELVKIGARIVRHGRYVVFQLAEVAAPRALFAEILHRIGRLRGSPVSEM
jgi:histidine ammonia-lyase